MITIIFALVVMFEVYTFYKLLVSIWERHTYVKLQTENDLKERSRNSMELLFTVMDKIKETHEFMLDNEEAVVDCSEIIIKYGEIITDSFEDCFKVYQQCQDIEVYDKTLQIFKCEFESIVKPAFAYIKTKITQLPA